MARGGKRDGAGRPKGALNKATADIKEAAREFAPDALKTLGDIMKSSDHPAAARVSAAGIILDRAYGKAAQSMDVKAQADMMLTVLTGVPRADHG